MLSSLQNITLQIDTFPNRFPNRFVYLLLCLLFLSSCMAQRPQTGVAFEDRSVAETDTTSYQIIVFDPGFEGWYLVNSKPLQYHTQSWLEFRNRQYVAAWNARVSGGSHSRFFETQIEYQPDLDYGLEVNHRLFYYFQFVEIKLGIPILLGLRPSKIIR